MCFFFFFKQKTAYEMRISDWSSDVCSSDLYLKRLVDNFNGQRVEFLPADEFELSGVHDAVVDEDRRILTAIPGAVPPPGHYLPLTGGDLTGDRKSVV